MIGGGFWSLGFEITELLSVQEHQGCVELLSVAKKLLAPSPLEAADQIFAVESLIDQATDLR